MILKSISTNHFQVQHKHFQANDQILNSQNTEKFLGFASIFIYSSL